MLTVINTGEERTFLQNISWSLSDLAIEIDITSSSINQLGLYATLGVGEVWRYDGTKLTFYQLQSGEYVAVDRSPTFPMLDSARVLEFLADCQIQGINQAVKILRAWVRSHLPTL